MRVLKLTNLLVDLIAAGPDLTNDEVWEHTDDGTIFEFLNHRMGFSGAIAVLEPADRLELMLEWGSLRSRVDPFRSEGRPAGWCLLIGYLVEGIVRRCESRNYRLTLETCGTAVPEVQVDR